MPQNQTLMIASVKKTWILLVFFFFITYALMGQSGNYASHQKKEHQLTFVSDNGSKLRFQFYTNHIIRITWIQKGENFFADKRYEMVARHNRSGTYTMEDKGSYFLIHISKGSRIKLNKTPLRYSMSNRENQQVLLAEKEGIRWRGDSIASDFKPDDSEHFCGMGHQTYGYVESIDLKGKVASSNYGEGKHRHWGPQGVLTVPFYMSSKGYGIFLNTTYHHRFNFGKNGRYEFSLDTKGFDGQMDYFFIYGPQFRQLLDRYTQLTGRPRLPQRSIFGLQLSDKGSPEHPGAEWWKKKITNHRQAGFPFDHIVNDNRWRAGSGAWSGSWFEWDSTRFPSPRQFNTWCTNHHVTVTLDLNRNIISSCEGWKPEYNLPQAEKYVAHAESAPDYSNPEMRNWIWELFWNKSFDPALKYPGDGLWIDETDDLHQLNDSLICANGRPWAENENYYPFLIAKAIIQEGWDNENNNLPPGIGEAKRPFLWMRSMMAGAQRYATHWTGDIYCTCQWMKNTIRGMQASGLSGFPYFNHDAGGFMDPGPDESLYIQWSMGLGSLTPIWRPHGMGQNKRWPLERSQKSQQAAKKYGKMRYQMMPYIYTYAHKAHSTGLPMARAMVIDHQNQPKAWKHDLQYMWGEEMLVAPVCSRQDTTRRVWLPDGQQWYAYWNDSIIEGGRVINYHTRLSEIPLFVKAGSIIPKYPYAKSTFTMNQSKLILDIYTGENAEFVLYEDDGVSEKYGTKKEKRTTSLEYNDTEHQITIYASQGVYEGAPSQRSYRMRIHGMQDIKEDRIKEEQIQQVPSAKAIPENTPGIYWNRKERMLIIITGKQPVEEKQTYTF